MTDERQREHDPAAAAKEAAAVKAVELAAAAVMIGLALVNSLAQRATSDPDFTATTRLRFARAYERRWAHLGRFLVNRAGACWQRAEQWRQAYEEATGGH